ncbi:MAG TPA: response regulator [Elusimicrobiota bacterium]|nr:response regulator [Elusimicrobiota bacterium]
MTPKPNAPTVLVIDDEVNIANFIKDFLEENGYKVIMAHTGGEGLRMATEFLPDTILLDVELPDTDGYTLCRTMRQTLSLRNKPILLLTVRNDQQNEITGLRAGADDYLTKPINTSRLLVRLDTAIHRNIRELDANPLTHLPGNASIVQEIERRIQSGEPFGVLYADLNNFKAFNDQYGFLRGDQAIRLAAQTIVSGVEDHVEKGAGFVGHIGGDDFVIVVPGPLVEKSCEGIISRFDQMIPQLYDETDRKQGFILGKTRQGQSIEFPIMGIALVAITNRDRTFNHPGEISSLASELKKLAKASPKSTYVMDRRRSDRPPQP